MRDRFDDMAEKAKFDCKCGCVYQGSDDCSFAALLRKVHNEAIAAAVGSAIGMNIEYADTIIKLLKVPE